MQNKVHVDAARGSRLQELGLDQEVLQNAVKAGELERSRCTNNDPRVFPGQVAWARTTRALRENLNPLGWQRGDEGNLPVVVNPKGDVAITVSSGDDGTGLVDRSPQTRNPK